MQKKYITTLLVLLVILISLIICSIDYLNFDKNINESDNAFVYVEGPLSFNFLDGNLINTEDEKNYTFSVTNTSDDPYYYNIALENVSGGENVELELTSRREGFQNINKKYPETNSQLATAIKINGLETHSYTLTLKNPERKFTKGTIIIAQEKDMANFVNVILKNNIINNASKTGIANDIATIDEGLIESVDEFGTSYYFRGNVQNNYVVFANQSWRIVKINGDGSVKLILNNLIENNTQFYNRDENYELNFASAKIYQSLNNWYQQNLGEYDAIIANSRYCTDATFETPTRIYINHNPIFECLGTTSTSKIGLLTADEAAFAGANNKIKNTDFYLYNSDIKVGWWTMSPAKNQNGNYSFIEVYQNGLLGEGTNGTLFRGTRPVINLVKRTNVTGTGTPTDPYIVNNA